VDLAARGKRDVQFTITRDAGRFDCEGYMNNGVGAGVFLFTADANYSKAMRDLGFGGIDDYKQFAMATVDVTAEFARQMKAEKLDGLDTDKLIALAAEVDRRLMVCHTHHYFPPLIEARRMVADGELHPHATVGRYLFLRCGQVTHDVTVEVLPFDAVLGEGLDRGILVLGGAESELDIDEVLTLDLLLLRVPSVDNSGAGQRLVERSQPLLPVKQQFLGLSEVHLLG
jgi:hypothetical protein